MSDIFEFPDLPPEPPREPRRPEPPWFNAPRGMLPGAVPLELVIARNDRAAVAVTKFGAYPVGFDFDLLIVVADAEDELDPMVMGFHRPGRRGAERQQMLRFGIQFADGSKVTNLPSREDALARHAQREGDRPASPVMHSMGGGGGSGEWRQRYWIWPLPPPGPLTFACEWPGAGIELAVITVDVAPLLEAATRAQTFFEDAGGGLGSASSISVNRVG